MLVFAVRVGGVTKDPLFIYIYIRRQVQNIYEDKYRIYTKTSTEYIRRQVQNIYEDKYRIYTKTSTEYIQRQVQNIYILC